MHTGILTTSYPRHQTDFAGCFVDELAQWLVKNGDEVTVIAPHPAKSFHKYVDVKNPIDPRKYSSSKKKPESFNKIAKRIGEKIRKQKGRSNDVLHIVDLEKLPSEIKANFTQKVIESAGIPNGIEFIN